MIYNMPPNIPIIHLKPTKEKSLQRFHPWIFSGALATDVGNLPEGCIVEVYSSDNQYLATGYIQHDSIAVKVISFEKTEIDRSFWEKRLLSAIDYRKEAGFFDNKETNVFRLVNGEGDFLPGLIIDWYDGVAVIQCHSQGMLMHKEIFCETLLKHLAGKVKSIYNKSDATLPKPARVKSQQQRHCEGDSPKQSSESQYSGLLHCVRNDGKWNFSHSLKRIATTSQDGFLYGQEDETCLVTENGNKYRLNLRESQKTGFFIDQRENRKLIQKLSNGKSILNAFGYTGGFSVSALRGGAQMVHTLDISKKAIEGCNENVKLNFGDKAPHQALAVDVLDYLTKMDESYDIIILDPPAFAKHQKDLKQGLKAYRNINQKALEKINHGGFLFTFSCSQAVSKQEFITLLFSTSVIARRNIRIVNILPHAQDHPVNIFHPEGEYLKGLLLYVE
jgi:23S rRNA (cytosine1962-C5)-methyltransferase